MLARQNNSLTLKVFPTRVLLFNSLISIIQHFQLSIKAIIKIGQKELLVLPKGGFSQIER